MEKSITIAGIYGLPIPSLPGGTMSNPNDPFPRPEYPNRQTSHSTPAQQPGPMQHGDPPYHQAPAPPPGYSQPYQSPEPIPVGPTYHDANAGDATGGLIPYKNPKALIAYYCSIGGIFPAIGLPFAIAAIVLGFLGLEDRKSNPIIKGSVHAWIGIIGGFLGLLLNLCIVFAIVAAVVGVAREHN